MIEDDAHFMNLALREAKKGLGRTSPNPAVGAIIVRDGRVVGRGYHKRAGTPHAEVHALHQAGDLARDAVMYVTLEPCNHEGRTPPCSPSVLRAGIKRLVVGMADPNPNVAGGGGSFLAKNGLSVTMGILEEECRWLNRYFLKHVSSGLPWVIMKAGLSLDGRIAASSGQSGWITNQGSRQKVHRLRDKVDAILIGIGTAVADNPSLTTRLPSGGRDPIRIVLDTHLRLDPTASVLNQESSAPTWVFCSSDADPEKQQDLEAVGAVVHRVGLDKEGRLNLSEVFQVLGKENVNSVLVEGGAEVHGALIRQRLVDEAMLFIAPLMLGDDGVPLLGSLGIQRVDEGPRLRRIRTRRYDDDILVEGVFPWSERTVQCSVQSAK